MNHFMNNLGCIKTILVFSLILLLTGPGFVQRAASVAIWVWPLSFLAQWLLGRVLDGFVDKYVLKEKIEETQKGIGSGKERAKRELEGIDREWMLKILNDAEKTMDEFKDHIAKNKMTDQQLIEYCRFMLDDRIKPLEERVQWLEERIGNLEKKLDVLAEDFGRVQEWLAAGVGYGYVDEKVLGLRTEDAKAGIVIVREESKTKLKPKDRKHLWKTLDRLDRLIKEFTKTHEMTDQEWLQYWDREFEKRMTPIWDELTIVKMRLDALEREFAEFKTQFRVQPIFGMSYQGYGLRNKSWKKRYRFLPFEVDEKDIFYGPHLSLGLWMNKTVYFEASVHYMGKQSVRILRGGVHSYDLTMEGMGISATGVITMPFPPVENCALELGGGYLRDKYKVGYKRVAPNPNQAATQEIGFLRMFEDPLAVIGLRFGRERVSGLLRLECLVSGDLDPKGYYVRFGLQYVL